jgi:hypothetical protein
MKTNSKYLYKKLNLSSGITKENKANKCWKEGRRCIV